LPTASGCGPPSGRRQFLRNSVGSYRANYSPVAASASGGT